MIFYDKIKTLYIFIFFSLLIIVIRVCYFKNQKRELKKKTNCKIKNEKSHNRNRIENGL